MRESEQLSREDIKEILYQLIYSRLAKSRKIGDLITSSQVKKLLDFVKPIFESENLMIELSPPLYIVGDIHGNVDDLLRIFELKKYPPYSKYLFLGDYIDRGKYGFEVVMILFSLKALYPERIFLIRGNHEVQETSSYYGFYDEIQGKYSGLMFYYFHSVFNCLPLICIISEKILCVHGGLSPDMPPLNCFKSMEKPKDLVTDSVLKDIIWSDPGEGDFDFRNNTRGCGYIYSSSSLDKYLKENNLEILIRSHEMCQNGFKFPYKDNNSCLTVFSSTNYCDRNNSGAVIEVSTKLELDVTVYEPLTKAQWERRRVIFPDYLLEKMVVDIPIIGNVTLEPYSDPVVMKENDTSMLLSL